VRDQGESSAERVEATACARRFDPALGVPFDGFARDFVHFAMQRAVSRERRALDERRGRIVEGGIDALQSGGDLAGSVDPWESTDADLAHNVAETADAVTATLLLGAATVARAQAGEDGLADRHEWSRALAQLDACLASLPDESRRVLELHHLAGRPLGAVAQALAMSEPTARRRHRDALVLLAKRMRAAGVIIKYSRVTAVEVSDAGIVCDVKVRRPGRPPGLGSRQGFRDGARDPAPHQEEAP